MDFPIAITFVDEITSRGNDSFSRCKGSFGTDKRQVSTDEAVSDGSEAFDILYVKTIRYLAEQSL